MTTTSTSRIPLQVNHDDLNNNNSFTSTTREYRTSSSSKGGGENAYDMRSMGDETDRIKNRMKEFEERCKRWREDFFARTHNMNEQLDQRVPLGENQYTTYTTSTAAPPHPPPPPQAPFSSSMHKSYLEDTEDGGKKYKIEFDIGDFKQNELFLTTNGKNLIVKGDRELKAGTATETKTFNRELTLPDYVDTNKMNAYLLDNQPSTKTSHLVAQSSVNNVLVIEAPVIMEKYTYRRSAFDNHQSPTKITGCFASPDKKSSRTTLTRSVSPNKTTTSTESHHTENKSSTSTTHTTSTIIKNGNGGYDEYTYTTNGPARAVPIGDEFIAHIPSPVKSQSSSNLNQSIAPELIPGYPIYDNNEGCVVYKFDLNGFDQSEIHLTITVDRTLEIKACKESSDHLGKIYREFKREIQLEPEVDANLIKNLLHEGK